MASRPPSVVVEGAAIPEFVQIGDDLRVDRVGILRAVAEAQDVQLRR